MANLTASFVKNTDKKGDHSDGNGLLLVVSKTKKSWFFKSRLVINGRKKEIRKKIGEYPVMSLSQARGLAVEIKASYSQDIDYFSPIRDSSITFRHLAEEWVDIKVAKGVKQSTIETDVKRLNAHIYPVIGDMLVTEITKPMLRQIADKSKVEHPYTANRLAGMFQSIFRVAVASEYIDTSPAMYLTDLYPKPKTTNNPHLSVEQIPELLLDIKKALQFGNIDLLTHNLILIQLHTLSRPGEAATLRWDYIDFDKAQWTFPAETMKNNEAHRQPLTGVVMELLREIQSLKLSDEYVFPKARRNSKSPHRNKETANKALRRIGYKDVLTAHGMRHTAATALGGMKYDRKVIDQALSHLVGDETSRTYNKDKAFEQRKEMLNAWSNFLSEQ